MRKNAWVICCCTAVLAAFGTFFRWLQDQVCFEAETGLAVRGSIWPYAVALMIVIAAVVLAVVCFRMKNQPHTYFPDSLPAALAASPRVRAIGGIVLGYIWSMLFHGILGKYDTSVVLESKYGFWGLIILICWQQVGYMMIIYIAGLQSIPEDMLEAARIDGANSWQMLWKVTIPNMMSSFTICIFLTLTNGFKLFDQNLALTGGRPFLQQPDGSVIKTTEMLALNIYNAFYSGGGNNRGVGQAKAVVFFILVAVIGLIQLQSTRKKEVQQ